MSSRQLVKHGKSKQKTKEDKKLQVLLPEVQAAYIAHAQFLEKEFGPMKSGGFLSNGRLMRRRDRDIPYGWPSFMKGTQQPVFRHKLATTYISLTAATLYNTVYNMQAQFLLNFNDASSMFDEYRFLRGQFEIIPTTTALPTAATPAGNYTGGACIDYGISTALANIDAAFAHDTFKWCQFVGGLGSHLPNGGKVHFPVKFEKLPDETWTPCTNPNVVVCYFKPLVPASAIPWTVANAFVIIGEFDVQYRGQAG